MHKLCFLIFNTHNSATASPKERSTTKGKGQTKGRAPSSLASEAGSHCGTFVIHIVDQSLKEKVERTARMAAANSITYSPAPPLTRRPRTT